MKRIPAPAPLLALALVAGLGSCQSPETSTPLPELALEPEPAPAWIHAPLTWDKLEAIELWLDRASASHDPRLVIEAELQLNEGRLLFTDRDVRSATLPRETLEVRVETAVAGFENVQINPSASDLQRQRAADGQRRAVGLLSGGGRSSGGLKIIARSEWGARRSNPRRMTTLRGSWTRITVHHSAETSSNPNGGTLEDTERTLRSIQKYHLEDPGHLWGDIGYHFLIDSGGRIFEGRELNWQGAHAGGSNNQQNIGICLLGNFEHGSPRPEATKSLELLLDHLCREHHIAASRVYPHRTFATTVCPGPELASFLRSYR
jgi:hypothetical protein